jgi:hypothetical protein
MKIMDLKIDNLRKATFASNGKAKNVTMGLSNSFLHFDCNGLNLAIEFASKLSRSQERDAFALVKHNMEEVTLVHHLLGICIC